MAALVSHTSSTLAGITIQNSSSSSQKLPRQQLLSEKLQLPKLKLPQPQYSSAATATTKKVRVLGHRGALFEAVENTLESFQKCIDWNCDGVELDVFKLKDDSLVVFHGSGTDKTPGLLESYCVPPHGDHTSILDMTLAQAQQLKFVAQSEHLVDNPEQVAAAQIPTLRQVLKLFQGTPLQITIELKGDGTVEPTIALVEEMSMAHQVVFSSFKHDRVRLVKQLRPHYRTAAIFPALVPDNFLQVLLSEETTRTTRPDEIHLRYDTCSIDRVRAAHKAGFHVMAWFRGPHAMKHDIQHVYIDSRNSEAHVYEMVVRTGVDAVCCNRPNLVLDLLNKHVKTQGVDDDDFDDNDDEILKD